MTDYGTPRLVPMLNDAGILPTRNFQEGQFDGFMDIAGQTMAETILVNRGSCYACPIYCKREVKVGPPYSVDPVYGGPEYETIAALGSLCGVNDLKAVAKGNQLCNAYGLDTISAGTSIAFAMECFEKGLLSKEDTTGIELKFGNAEAMMTMIEMIARREGLGDILAEGTKRAAEKIGQGAAEYAMQIKGQEIPMHEPRGKAGLGLGYATSPTGADHMHNIHDSAFAVDGKGAMTVVNAFGVLDAIPATELSSAKVRLFYYFVNWRHFQNSAITCMFVPLEGEHMVQLVNGATGWNTSVFELMKVGERALALARIFNAREGYTAKDDVIPERLYKAFTSGPLKDKGIGKETMQKALQTYYEMAGWDPERAIPTAEKLQELDLGWLVPELDKINTGE
jgi:aldehyde:ferredoxin oxidoreductase